MVYVLTANRLQDGHVVYLTDGRLWTENIQAAERLLTDDERDRAEEFGVQSVKNRQVVDVNLIPLAGEENPITPKRLRERIRAIGPTVRPDLSRTL